MENNLEENLERERLKELEKKFHRANKFFTAAILTSIVASFNLSLENPKTYEVIAVLGTVPLTFGAWLNVMYYKTEEYCRLAQKFYCNRKS